MNILLTSNMSCTSIYGLYGKYWGNKLHFQGNLRGLWGCVWWGIDTKWRHVHYKWWSTGTMRYKIFSDPHDEFTWFNNTVTTEHEVLEPLEVNFNIDWWSQPDLKSTGQFGLIIPNQGLPCLFSGGWAASLEGSFWAEGGEFFRENSVLVTLWWTYKKLWKITIFNGKIHYKWSFSIAMLVHQRVIPSPIFKMAILWSQICGNNPLHPPWCLTAVQILGEGMIWCAILPLWPTYWFHTHTHTRDIILWYMHIYIYV